MADKTQPDELGITDPGTAAAGMPAEVPRLTDISQVKALAPGTEFIDPTGAKGRKPYSLEGLDEAKWAEAFREVPDGAPFIDPHGNRARKPEYEPLDMGDQILVNMVHGDDKHIERILRGQYGEGAVKREPITNDLYVERDGKKMKPGKGDFGRRAAAATVSGLAPATGFMGGSMVGSILGVPTGPGAVATGMAGAGLGGAGGEAFNQLVLSLAGYPSTLEDYAKTVGMEGAYAAAGVPAGHIVGKAVGGTATGLQAVGRQIADRGGDLKKILGGALGRILGATPESAAWAERMAANKAKPPPSEWMFEAPYISTLVEVFDPTFRKHAGGVNVIEASAKAYYDKNAPKLMEDMGLKPPAAQPLTEATSPVALEPFGTVMVAKAAQRNAVADAHLEATIAAAKKAAVDKAGDPAAFKATQDALRAAQAEAAAAAQDAIDNGFKSIQTDVNNSIKLVNAGENPGDMDRLWAEKFTVLRKAVAKKATQLYNVVTEAAGEARPNVEPIAQAADDLLAQVPPEFAGRYPGIVRQLRSLRPPPVEPDPIKAALNEAHGTAPKWEPPTYGQLAQLRSMLRNDIQFGDLTRDVKQGALAHFDGQINKVLFDEGAPAELQNAAKALRTADDFYGKNIKKFKSESAKWVIQQLEAGVPQDAKAVAEKFLQPNMTEEIRMLRKVGGKQLWSAVQAADTQGMLNASKTLVPGEVDGLTFAKQVLDRHQNGILENAYDKEGAAKLLHQAQRVMMLKGKIPMETRPGDTVHNLMRRSAALGEEIEKEAAADPAKVLKREMDKFRTEERAMRKGARADKLKDPLRFLTQDTSAGAIKAAENILRSPDRILTIAREFGESSPEFEMLRQVWAERLFQRGLDDTGKLAGDFAKHITPEVQGLMFPGTTLSDALQLAKDMSKLMPAGGPDAGASIAAKSRVLSPLTNSPNWIAKTVGHLPGSNALARQYLGWFYKTVSDVTTGPTFTRFIAEGLRGSQQMQELAGREWRKKYFPKIGRAIGAELGAIEGAPDEKKQEQPVPLTRQAAKPWQDLYREKYGSIR